MKYVSILLFILEFFKIANFTHVCTNSKQTIQAKTDELIFFESLDYPKLHTSSNCSINFVLDDRTQSVRGTLIVQIQSSGIAFTPFVYENVFSILFENKQHNFESFRGYALFDDWGDDCPLESISRVNPFQFSDETQVIYLQSSYYPNTQNASILTRQHPCLWQFSAPIGYGFKYAIIAANLKYPTQLNIENSTEILQTERNVPINHAYYNKDNYLKFYLYDKIIVAKSLSLLDMVEFAVIVSIFKNGQKKVDGGCIITKNGSVDTWTNLNDNGYCYNLNQILVCECSNSTIFIRNITSFLCIASSFADNKNDCHQTYCPNLRCNYTLVFHKIYQNKIFYIDINLDILEISDSYKVFTNNVNVFTSNKTTRLVDGQRFIPPIFLTTKNKNVIEISTYKYSQSSYHVTINIKMQEALPFTYNITLSKDKFHHVVDVYDDYNGISIEYVSPQPYNNVSIQAYALTDFWIYKDGTFNEYIRYCRKSNLNCKVNLKNLSILPQHQSFFVTRLSDVYPIGCVFKQYFFYPTGNTTITAISNLSGSCKILLVFDSNTYLIKQLWTNSKEKNVTVYFGANEEKYFFEFNSESAQQWENMLLTTRIYTFEIPPNSSILIRLVYQPYIFYGYVIQLYNIITISKYPFQSLLSTFDYGISRNYEDATSGLNVTYILANHLNEYILELQVIHYNLSDSFECFFIKNNQRLNVTQLGQKFYVKNSSMTFNYIYDDWYNPSYHSADQGVLFSVNLIKP